MSIELATAYISLVPSAVGIQQNIAKELSPTSAVAAAEGLKAGNALEGNLTKGLSGFDQSTSKIGQAFSKLGNLGGSFAVPFSASLAAMGAGLDKATDKAGGLGTKLASIGGAELLAAGAGLLIVGKEATSTAESFEAAHARLQTAVKDVGQSFDAYSGQISATDNRLTQLGFKESDTETSLALLTTATKNVGASLNLMGLAADIARGRNTDLVTATGLLVKVETGHVALLGRLGINTKDATGNTITQTEAIQRLTALYGGQAQAFTETFAGKMAVLGANASKLSVNIGTALIPQVERLASGVVAAVTGFEQINAATGGFLGKTLEVAAVVPAAVFAVQKLSAALKAVPLIGGGLSAAVIPAAVVAGLIETARVVTTAVSPNLNDSAKATNDLSIALLHLASNGSLSGAAASRLGTDFGNLAKSVKASDATFSSAFQHGAEDIAHFFGGSTTLDRTAALANNTQKALLNLYKTDPGDAISAFARIKAGLEADGETAGQVDQAFKKFEKTIGALAGPTDAATTAQTRLSDAESKYENDILTHKSGTVQAADYKKVSDASTVVAGAQQQVSAAALAGAGSLGVAGAAATQGSFAYLGLANSITTVQQALDAINTAAFAPVVDQTNIDRAKATLSDSITALTAPPDSSGSGGSGVTPTAAAIDAQQKELAVRDARLGVEQATTGVTSAELQLAQARQSNRETDQALITAEQNYRTVLKGVAADSLVAKQATEALTQAKLDAQGSQLDVRSAQRSLATAKSDARLSQTGIEDAQTTLTNDQAAGADPEQILKDQVALTDARIAASGASDSVKRAELDLSNAELAAKQKTQDLTAAQKSLNTTLHGYPPNSKEAKDATNQLHDAQIAAKTSANGVTTAMQGLQAAQDNTSTSALTLKRDIADLDGKLTTAAGSGGGAHKMASALDGIGIKLDTVKTNAIDVATQVEKSLRDSGHTLSQALAGEIGQLLKIVDAVPGIASALGPELRSLEAQLLTAAVGEKTPSPTTGVSPPGVGPTRDQGPTGDRGPANTASNSRAATTITNNYEVHAHSLDAKSVGPIVVKSLQDQSDRNGSIRGVRFS